MDHVISDFEVWFSEHWIDVGSIVFAVGAGWGRAIANTATRTNTNKAIVNAMNGAALFPFIVLILVLFSDRILNSIIHSSKVTFGLAGVIGTIWTVNELRR